MRFHVRRGIDFRQKGGLVRQRHFTTTASLLLALLVLAAACTYASAADGSDPGTASEFTPRMAVGVGDRVPADASLAAPKDRGDVPLANGVLRQAVASTSGDAEFPQGLSREGDSVRVEILHNLDSAEISALVSSLDGSVYGEVPGVLAEALVPLDSLVALEANPDVEYVRPPLAVNIEPSQPPSTDNFALPQGALVVGEEVAKMNADAWHAAGYTGDGVKIGIIDSFNSTFWNPAQAAGEVPAPSGTFCQIGGFPCDLFDVGGDHGVAVSEIVHEMAPDADLYLATVYTAADLQAAVNYFAGMGVDIISRSQTAEYDGPGDGTGPIADVMNSAVSQGMTWFNSAGNAAGSVAQPFDGSYWRGGWFDDDGDTFLDFDVTAVGELLPFACGFVNGVRWSDWGPAAGRTDYDVYVFDDVDLMTGAPIEEEVHTLGDQQGGAPPIENFNFQVECDTEDDIDFLAIENFDSGSGTGSDVIEFMTNIPGIYYWQNLYSASGPMSDTASPGGLTIGAIDPPNGTTIATYSSQGPTNDERIKPDLSAAAGVVSYTYGSRAARFSGTSASTPGAAGAGALALGAGMEARTLPAGGSLPTTPAQLKTFLLNNTVERGSPGADNIYGEGELVLPNPPAAASPTPTPTGGTTATPTPTGGPTSTPTPTPANEPDKKLFNGRWDLPLIGNDYDAWMDLTLSQPYYLCDGGAGAGSCENKWSQPAQDAIDDWNSQQTTVRFVLQPGQSDDHEVHVVINDSIAGDPSLLGLAVFYDDTFDDCNPQVCDWRYGDALIGDDVHSGVFGGMRDRQATIGHEVGHLLSLRHESTNADESVLYPCGMDDTGPIPHSIMSYNCIDPVANGGLGEYYVQDWDVCGINHAYFDPNVGMAGCGGGGTGPTPTPTATPGNAVTKGDNDCDNDIDSVDALKGLQKIVGLSPQQQPGCPELGSQFASIFGDMDCDDDLDSVDQLQILRHLAGIGANLPPGCDPLGALLVPN